MPSREEQEESVAILLGEPFEPHLWQAVEPFCLLPLCTIPLLSYALDSLCKFDKVYLYLRQASLDALRESTAGELPANVVVKTTLALTEGEVLREADDLQLKVPFLLLKVGHISNVDLKAYFDYFNVTKRKADANLIMDCLVSSSLVSPSMYIDTFGLNPQLRLVHYDHAPRFPPARRLKVPKEVLLEHPNILLRQDLSHLGAYFCSPDVLPLFTENFDYQTMHHFIHGILTSDLLGKTISCSSLDSKPFKGKNKAPEYARFIQTPQSLISSSLDVLARAFYPITPDEYLPGSSVSAKDRFLSQHSRVYLGRKVNLARTVALSRSLIGHLCSISANTSISNSVIGDKTTIGEKCALSNVIVGSSCIIEDECTLRDCYLGDFVKVLKGSAVSGGSLIGNQVTLANKIHGQNVVSSEPEEEDFAVHKLSQDSVGFSWPLNGLPAQTNGHSSDQSEDEDELDPRNYKYAHIGFSRASKTRRRSTTSASSVSSLSEMEENLESVDSDEESSQTANDESTTQTLQAESFEQELLASVDRAFKEQHTVDNLIIELKTLRMSSNVSLDLVKECFLTYLLNRIPAHASVKEQYTVLSGLLEDWGTVLLKLSPPFLLADQISVILTVQSLYASKNDSRTFLLWLRVLYETDIIEEEGVIEWWKSEESRSTGGSVGRELRAAAKSFVERLLEEDSGSE